MMLFILCFASVLSVALCESIQVLTPSANTVWTIGQAAEIAWTFKNEKNFYDIIDIDLYQQSSRGWIRVMEVARGLPIENNRLIINTNSMAHGSTYRLEFIARSFKGPETAVGHSDMFSISRIPTMSLSENRLEEPSFGNYLKKAFGVVGNDVMNAFSINGQGTHLTAQSSAPKKEFPILIFMTLIFLLLYSFVVYLHHRPFKLNFMPTQIGKKFFWKEISLHNTRKSSWVSYRGKVYDVTSWISKHPGGSDVILAAAGRDITEVFECYHYNSKKALSVLEKYEIGLLIDNELPVFPSRGQFYQTLKERISNYFIETGQDPKFHPWMIVRYFAVLLTVGLSYYLQFFYAPVASSIISSTLFAALLGFSCAQVGLLLLHDGSHCAFTHNPIVWKFLGYSHDFINGASFMSWVYQHVFGHHPYTNIAGADPDISTNDYDIRRIKPSQPWFIPYRLQHLYAPVLYGVLGIKVRVSDVRSLFFEKMNDKIRVNPLELDQILLFWIGKLFFCFYRIVIPIFLGQCSWLHVIRLFMISDLVSSYWLAFTFQANHVVDDVEWPITDKNKIIKKDWAEMQVVTAQDYAHKGFFWTNFAGALNYQIVHHLFPAISQHYYPELAPLVIRTCQEYKVRYRVKNDWLEAFTGHVNLLRVLGAERDLKMN